MTTFTEQQIADVLAEMKRQARGKSSLTGISWGPLKAIAGEDAYKVFKILRQRNLLRTEYLYDGFSTELHHFI
jgi:hypothetical protein